MRRRRFLGIAAAFACAPRFAEAATWQGHALGAEVRLTLHGPRAETAPVLAALPAWLDAFEQDFSLYRATSALTRLNRTGLVAESDRFHTLMDHVSEAHRLTDGLFDPTIQPLWQALARGEDTSRARALLGWDKVTMTRGAIRLAPGQRLTLNGIAQGFATDLLSTHLRQLGFSRALVDLGEHRALGGPFRLGLSDPGQGLLGHRTLRDSAIASSSPGALHLGPQAHILAPDGRAPLWSTVSIEAASATLADAMSTAAIFMPRSDLSRLKTQADLRRITLVDAEGNLTTL